MEVRRQYVKAATEDLGSLKDISEEYHVIPVVDEVSALTLSEIPQYGDSHPNVSGLVVVSRTARIDPSGAATVVSVRYGDNPATWQAAEPYSPLNDTTLVTWSVQYVSDGVDVPFAYTEILGSPPGFPASSSLVWRPDKSRLGVSLIVFKLRTAIQSPSLVQIFLTGSIADRLHYVEISPGNRHWLYYRPGSISPATQGTPDRPAIWTVDHEYIYDPGNQYASEQVSGQWQINAAQNAITRFPGGGPIGLAKPYMLSSLPGAPTNVYYARPPYELVDMLPSTEGIAPISSIGVPPSFVGTISKPLMTDGYNYVLGLT